MTANPEAGVIAAIDALERDGVDDLVDWQMNDSPAAVAERGHRSPGVAELCDRLYGSSVDWQNPAPGALAVALSWREHETIERLQAPARERIAATFSYGNPTRATGGDMFAITPDGERIEPDADGALRCSVDDHVFMLGGGGCHGPAFSGASGAAALSALADTPAAAMADLVSWGRELRNVAASLGPVSGPVADSSCGGNVT